jgi:hypothetical protein
MSVQLIPGGLVGLGQYIIGVRVFGETLGGRDLESSQLTFPVTICDGCLVNFPNEAFDQDIGECIGGEEPVDPPPCVLGQDDSIDCRYCAASNARCLTPAR